jgi:hypothetical protein
MFSTTRPIRALCATALVSVALGTAVPTFAYAHTADGNVTPTAQGSALPPGVVAVVNGVSIPQMQLDAMVHASGKPVPRRSVKG